MTQLVVSLQPTTFADFRSRAERVRSGGAEAVEVRIDDYTDDAETLAKHLREHRECTWIVTCRSSAEGGHFPGDTMQRVSKLIATARNTGAFVDFEFADWRRSSNIRQKIRLAAAGPGEAGIRLILSAHDFSGRPHMPETILDEMLSVEDISAVKVAYAAGHICDSFKALDLMHEHGPSATAIAMGADGAWTRVLAKKLGAFSSYCACDEDERTAPGQFTLGEMIDLYRWKSLDADTRVFGVVGDPVAHSRSPLLHNHWFAEESINAVYLPLPVRAGGDGLVRFLEGCQTRDWLNVAGLSVTLPHKTSALQWSGDGADATARSIGAANTLHFPDGKVRAYNTDAASAVESIATALGCDVRDLEGTTVDLLGTGGAARAVLYALTHLGCRVTIYGRARDKADRLAEAFEACAESWSHRTRRRGEILINATSVGLAPNDDDSPMPPDAFGRCRLVFDLIYNPLQTRLLREASAEGVATMNGLDMFVRQAAGQFTIWTGRSPDVIAARNLLEEKSRCHNRDTR